MSPPRWAPDWLREVPFAHRGLHDADVVESSIPAFAAAAEAGYGVELDVRLSRDGVPVVIHDPTLERVAGIPSRVAALDAAQLAQVRLADGVVGVPTLAAALRVLRGAPVMVELKQSRPWAGRLEARVAAVLDDHAGPWCVASFNPGTLRWFRHRRPDAVRVLTAGPLTGVRMPAVVRARLARLHHLDEVAPHAVSYDLRALPTPETDRWRTDGGTLVTWTAVGDGEVALARTLADNVVFEHARP